MIYFLLGVLQFIDDSRESAIDIFSNAVKVIRNCELNDSIKENEYIQSDQLWAFLLNVVSFRTNV